MNQLCWEKYGEITPFFRHILQQRGHHAMIQPWSIKGTMQLRSSNDCYIEDLHKTTWNEAKNENEKDVKLKNHIWCVKFGDFFHWTKCHSRQCEANLRQVRDCFAKRKDYAWTPWSSLISSGVYASFYIKRYFGPRIARAQHCVANVAARASKGVRVVAAWHDGRLVMQMSA